MLEPTNEYVIIGNVLYQLHYSESSGRKVLVHNSERIWYDEGMDGKTIDRDEANGKYPEYFV